MCPPDTRRKAAGGTFTSTRVVERGEELELVAFPDVRVAVSDVLKWVSGAEYART